MRRQLALIALAALAILVAGCGGDRPSASPTSVSGAATSSGSGPAATPQLSGEVTVFAAASLTDAFGAIGKSLEAANPGAKITFNFGGSSTLVGQIMQGAPADVFASADQPNMKKLTDAGLQAGPPSDFARNKLEIVVPKGNPKKIGALADLARPGVTVALCAEAVPCGTFARQALQRAGVSVNPVSLEDSVKGVLSKAQLGEIDAGIVYVTDVQAGGDKVEGVPIADAVNPPVVYPIATVKGGRNPVGAQVFVSYVRSAAGQAVLARYGFLPVSG